MYITNGLLLLVPIRIPQTLSFSGDMSIFFFTSDKISRISPLLSPQMEILGKPPKKSNRGKNYSPNQFMCFIKTNSLKYTQT